MKKCFLPAISAILLAGTAYAADIDTGCVSTDNDSATTVATPSESDAIATPAFEIPAYEAPSPADKKKDGPKISITPRGRVLLDGAMYFPDGDGFSDGAVLPDIRLGAKVKYGQWASTIDIGFAYGKISMKDVYIQYNFNEFNYLRGGYFVHQFGLNAATSSSMKPAMIAPTSDTFFAATGRNIGVEYVYDKDKWFVGVSAIIGGNSMTSNANEQGKVSWGALNRTVFRPYHQEGLVTQLGCSFWYQTAMHKKVDGEDGKAHPGPGYFDYSAKFPTEVSKVNMLGANITDAKGVFKLSPEWLVAVDKVALEGQFYYMNVARKNMHAYTAKGVYSYLRTLLVGNKYGYSHGDAGLAQPGPKSLEMILGYDYTNARCSKTDILGGISNDFSAAFTYYFNKYLLARLRYSYTEVKGSAVMYNRHVNTIQARIQIIF